jgi:nucleotide-binding universal stress UspA family protein
MFTTILIPLDGSMRAETTLPIAARIARNTGANLVLVRVVSFLSEYQPTIITHYPSMLQAAMEADLEEAAAYLERIASSAELAGISVKTTVQFGAIAPTILSVANSYASDLIIICSHGSTHMIHWMMGSIAEKIARHSSIPVLVVREDGTHMGKANIEQAQPLRMLIPLDGSTGAQAALEPGAELLTALAASGQKTALHLARVSKQSQSDHQDKETPLENHRELERIKGYLQQTTEQIRLGSLAPTIAERHIPVTWSVVLDSDTASALLRVAEQGDDTEGAGAFGGCDLIAISSHGRSGLQRWVLGSITERVLHATRHPILIVRPPETTTCKKPIASEVNKTFNASLRC